MRRNRPKGHRYRAKSRPRDSSLGVAGAGHSTYFERPDLYNDALIAFIEKAGRRAKSLRPLPVRVTHRAEWTHGASDYTDFSTCCVYLPTIDTAASASTSTPCGGNSIPARRFTAGDNSSSLRPRWIAPQGLPDTGRPLHMNRSQTRGVRPCRCREQARSRRSASRRTEEVGSWLGR